MELRPLKLKIYYIFDLYNGEEDLNQVLKLCRGIEIGDSKVNGLNYWPREARRFNYSSLMYTLWLTIASDQQTSQSENGSKH